MRKNAASFANALITEHDVKFAARIFMENFKNKLRGLEFSIFWIQSIEKFFPIILVV